MGKIMNSLGVLCGFIIFVFLGFLLSYTSGYNDLHTSCVDHYTKDSTTVKELEAIDEKCKYKDN